MRISSAVLVHTKGFAAIIPSVDEPADGFDPFAPQRVSGTIAPVHQAASDPVRIASTLAICLPGLGFDFGGLDLDRGRGQAASVHPSRNMSRATNEPGLARGLREAREGPA